MKVLIPSPLRSCTNIAWVQAQGTTVGEVLADLYRRYPGIRFRMIDERTRMRRHVRFFVNQRQTFDPEHPLGEADELHVVQARSGG